MLARVMPLHIIDLDDTSNPLDAPTDNAAYPPPVLLHAPPPLFELTSMSNSSSPTFMLSNSHENTLSNSEVISPSEDSQNPMVQALQQDQRPFIKLDDVTFIIHVSSNRTAALKCCRTVFVMALAVATYGIIFLYFMFQVALFPYLVNYSGNGDWSDLSTSDKMIVQATIGVSAPLSALFLWSITRSLIKYSTYHRNLSTALSFSLGLLHTGIQFADPFIGDVVSKTNIGLLIFFAEVCGNCYVTHLYLKGLPGAHGKHMIFCAISMLTEAANGVCIRLLPSFYKSTWFPWVAPFVFCLSSLFTRKAAEVSILRISSASKVSTISTCICVFLQRLGQSALLDRPQDIFRLEAFFVFFQLLLRVTLYYRHGFISKLMSGRFVLKPVKNPRSQRITSRSILSEAIFDTSFFLILTGGRYALQGPTVVHPGLFVFMVVACVAFQLCGVYMTVIVISYFERVPIQEIDLSSENFRDRFGHLTYYSVSLLFAMAYFVTFIPQFWYPGALNGFKK